MRLANAATASLAGLGVVALVGRFVPVAVGLALGAAVATAVTLWADTDRYALVGATLLLGVGTTVLVTDWFPAAWGRTPLVACWLFGLLSLFVVVARFLLGFVGRRVVAVFVPDEEAGSIWDALSAFAGTLLVAWSVLTAQEKAARTGGVAVGGSVTMAANAAGYELPVYVPLVHDALSVTVGGYALAVPLWVLETGVDATMVVFVGCVVVGFHTLGTVAATWRAVKDTTGYATDRVESTGDPEVVSATGEGSGRNTAGPASRRHPDAAPGPDATGAQMGDRADGDDNGTAAANTGRASPPGEQESESPGSQPQNGTDRR